MFNTFVFFTYYVLKEKTLSSNLCQTAMINRPNHPKMSATHRLLLIILITFRLCNLQPCGELFPKAFRSYRLLNQVDDVS